MKHNYTLRYATPIFCCFVLMLAAVMPFLPASGEERIYDETIRLHVIANSDSDEDQSLKLKVRDGILGYVSRFLDSSEGKEASEEKLSSRLDEIRSLAEKTVAENGYGYRVDVVLDKEYYPTCEYEGVSLPEGKYTSLRVIIGNGEGHNWWCVLYPTLCTSTAKPEKELASAGFTRDEIRVLTESEDPRYRIKFKILEIASQIIHGIAG